MKKTFLNIIIAAIMALVLILAIPLSASADSTTGVTGTVVASTITVVAPSVISFGNFVKGINNATSATPGSVTITPGSASPSGWSVTAKDQNQGINSGCMVGSGGPLSPLGISQDGVTFGPTDLGITYTGVGLTGSLPLYARQYIVGNETPGTYNIIIVFTGTITP